MSWLLNLMAKTGILIHDQIELRKRSQKILMQRDLLNLRTLLYWVLWNILLTLNLSYGI